MTSTTCKALRTAASDYRSPSGLTKRFRPLFAYCLNIGRVLAKSPRSIIGQSPNTSIKSGKPIVALETAQSDVDEADAERVGYSRRYDLRDDSPVDPVGESLKEIAAAVLRTLYRGLDLLVLNELTRYESTEETVRQNGESRFTPNPFNCSCNKRTVSWDFLRLMTLNTSTPPRILRRSRISSSESAQSNNV